MGSLTVLERLVLAQVERQSCGYLILGVAERGGGHTLKEPSLVWDHAFAELLEDRPADPGSVLTAIRQLAVCDERTAARLVEDIARAHGPLELCEHGWPFTHDGNCYPTHAEPVSFWVLWARVVAAAEAGAVVPADAARWFDLPAGIGAREVVRVAAEGAGWQTGPRRRGEARLLSRVADEIGIRCPRPVYNMCPECRKRPPRGLGTYYCEECAPLQPSVLKSRRRRRRETTARHVLKALVPNPRDPSHADDLRRIAEPRPLLHASSLAAPDPVVAEIRRQARRHCEDLRFRRFR